VSGLRLGREFSANLEAVDHRQQEIQDNEIGAITIDRIQGGWSVSGFPNLESREYQGLSEHPPEGLIILHDQNLVT
jgi:hypothetical protein